MADQKPLVEFGGKWQELPTSDRLKISALVITSTTIQPLLLEQQGVGSLAFIDGYSGGAIATNHNIAFRAARGTIASPSASKLNDRLGWFNFRGYGTTGFAVSQRSSVGCYAAEDWTDTSHGTYLTLGVTKIGTVAAADALLIKDNLSVVATTCFGYVAEKDNGSSGAASTIDFKTSDLQKQFLTGACAYTLVPPSQPGKVQLKLTAATGAGQPTFTNTINWFEASAPPAVNLTVGKFSIFSFYYDGANWFGSGGRYGL